MKRVHFQMGPISLLPTADLSLALGDRPIMSLEEQEAQEITGQSDVLVASLAMITEDRLRALKCSWKEAIRQGILIIFDPVGVGASEYRRRAAKELLTIGHPSIIKGNPEEIRCLTRDILTYQGVDSSLSSEEVRQDARELSERLDCIVVTTGKRDLLHCKGQEYSIEGEAEGLPKISGTGCLLNALLAHHVEKGLHPEPIVKGLSRYKELMSKTPVRSREDILQRIREEYYV